MKEGRQGKECPGFSPPHCTQKHETDHFRRYAPDNGLMDDDVDSSVLKAIETNLFELITGGLGLFSLLVFTTVNLI